jgi:hypothetical protein
MAEASEASAAPSEAPSEVDAWIRQQQRSEIAFNLLNMRAPRETVSEPEAEAAGADAASQEHPHAHAFQMDKLLSLEDITESLRKGCSQCGTHAIACLDVVAKVMRHHNLKPADVAQQDRHDSFEEPSQIDRADWLRNKLQEALEVHPVFGLEDGETVVTDTRRSLVLKIHGVRVCQKAWCAWHGVAKSTFHRRESEVKEFRVHIDRRTVPHVVPAPKKESCMIFFTNYLESIGEPSPEDRRTHVPPFHIADLYEEYRTFSRTKQLEAVAKLGYFAHVWDTQYRNGEAAVRLRPDTT